MEQIKTIAKQANISYFSKIISKGLGYFTMLLLTSFLTPDQFGAFQLMHTILIVGVMLSVWGLKGVLSRYIPFLKNRSDSLEKSKFLIKKLFGLTVGLSFLILGVFYLFPEQISSLFKTENISSEFISGLKILMILVPAYTLIRLTSSTFKGYKDLFYPSLINNIFKPVGKTILAGVLLILGGGLIDWIFSYTVLIIFLSVLFVCLLYSNYLKHWWKKTKEKKPDMKELFSFSWPLIINNLFGVVSSNVSALLIGYFIATKEVGVHSIYVATVSVIGFLIGAISGIFKPIASENSFDELDKTKKLYKRVSKWGYLFSGAFLILIYFFGENIIKLLFSSEYTILPAALTILGAGKLIKNALGPSQAFLVALGKTKWKLYLSVIYTATIVITSVLLIPKFSIAGAAAGIAIADATQALAGLAAVIKNFKVHPFSQFTFNITIVLFIFILVSWGIKIVFYFEPLDIILSAVILSAAFTTLVYISNSFDEIDWYLVKKFLNKIKVYE